MNRRFSVSSYWVKGMENKKFGGKRNRVKNQFKEDFSGFIFISPISRETTRKGMSS